MNGWRRRRAFDLSDRSVSRAPGISLTWQVVAAALVVGNLTACACGTREIEYKVTVSIDPSSTGTGRITSNPSGIDCPDDCEETFFESGDYGDDIIVADLVATPDPGSRFVGWSDKCSRSLVPGRLEEEAETGCTSGGYYSEFNCVARFESDQFSLALGITGIGTVFSEPPGIDCPDACEAAFPPGAIVELTPGDGTFSSWGGDCSGTATPLTIEMDGPKSCTATFTDGPTPVSLTVRVVPENAGTVRIENVTQASSFECASTCTETYEFADELRATPTARPDYQFVAWGGDCEEPAELDFDGGSIEFGLDGDMDCTATFAPETLGAQAVSVASSSVEVAGVVDHEGSPFLVANLLDEMAASDVGFVSFGDGEATLTGPYEDLKINEALGSETGSVTMAGLAIDPDDPFESNAQLLSLDPDTGELVWRSFVREGWEAARSVEPTADGGAIIAGTIGMSDSGSLPYDFWVIKTDAAFDIEWQVAIGGTDSDEAYDAIETSDGGFIVVGDTTSFGDWTQALVVALDSDGEVLWQRVYGGPSSDAALVVREVEDGFVVGGQTSSWGGGDYDIWVFQIDTEGEILWQHTYGDADWQSLGQIGHLDDGGLWVSGTTTDVESWDTDVVLLELTADGELAWGAAYGTTGYDGTPAVVRTDSGFLMGAALYGSFDVDVGFITARVDPDGGVAGCEDVFGFTEPLPGSFVISTSKADSIEGAVLYAVTSCDLEDVATDEPAIEPLPLTELCVSD